MCISTEADYRAQSFRLEIFTGHEDLVLLFLIAMCQDIGALEGLWEEAEDVVNDEDRRFGIARASHVCLHTIDGHVFALGLVTLGHDRWYGTAGVGLRHGR